MRPIIQQQGARVCLLVALILTSCTQVLTPIPTPSQTEILSTSIPTKTLPINTPTEISTRMPDFQQGVVYTSWWNGEYSSSESDTTISKRIKSMGVNWLSVVVTCYQEKFNSTEILCDKTKTPTDSDLNHVIQYAHSLGLKVMLKPHVDLSNDSLHWRGDIAFENENAWKEWFTSYNQFITHYAVIARETNTDYFVVGTELAMTTSRLKDWLAVIEVVKEVYKGPLTYAANHDGEEFNIEWWDKMDAIGVDAYYSLTEVDNPTVSQLVVAWQPTVAELEELSNRWKRPIIFTEIGYQSRNGTNITPWYVEDKTVDLQEQADCYQAVFEAFSGKNWWAGVFWWNWTIHPNQGGNLDVDFTGNNKPAEDILIENYSKVSSSK